MEAEQSSEPAPAAAEEKYYALDEAAERLKLQRAEVYRRVVDGALKGEKRERRLHFAESELARYEKLVADEGQAMREALQTALALFAGRLEARGQLGELPEIAPENTDAQVAELGRRILRDALLDAVPDLYFDPLYDGMRLLAGPEGNRRELARFPAALAKKLGEWGAKLAPLPAEGAIREALGQQECEGQKYQFRLKAVPTLLGQLLHLHFFLDHSESGLAHLGYLPAQIEALGEMLSGRAGLLVLAGPTGPASERHQLTLARRQCTEGSLVVSLQRRVQYREELLVQLDLGQGANADFASVWRTALDMRPNAIVVEDVSAGAEVDALLQGVNAGTVVVAQANTHSARDALLHLLGTDIDAASFARSVLGIVEIVALRRLCPHCRQSRVAEGAAAECLGSDALVGVASGCEKCGDGYLGHRSLFSMWSSELIVPWIPTAKEGASFPSAAAEIGFAAAARQAVLDLEVHWLDARPYLPQLSAAIL